MNFLIEAHLSQNPQTGTNSFEIANLKKSFEDYKSQAMSEYWTLKEEYTKLKETSNTTQTVSFKIFFLKKTESFKNVKLYLFKSQWKALTLQSVHILLCQPHVETKSSISCHVTTLKRVTF